MVTRRHGTPDPIPEMAKDWFGQAWNSTAPDTESVRRFIRNTRRTPDVRLRVLTDLRQHTVRGNDVAVESLWTGLIAVYIAAVAVIATTWAGGLTASSVIICAVLMLAAVVVVLILVMGVTVRERHAHRRATHAHLWLEAINDQLQHRR